ncbi:hypothetical protein WMY93_033379 [Mugilogobius chulae]|uniref:IRG-type G domain-containing protein n=1 Tax=Mugilogobius chulae TaxID=88201 RepID=A0AAW0MHC6_9GOBI
MEDVKTALQNADLVLALDLAKKLLEEKERVTLTIAITGSGKSTLINALREVSDKDDEAAPVGLDETTMKPTQYTYPNNPNITLWDLPGIGTTKFPAEDYVKENDAKLALEIQKMKKKFYFIRTKIDNNIRDAERTQREFNKEQTLCQIRNACVKKLKELKIESPKSSWCQVLSYICTISLTCATLWRKICLRTNETLFFWLCPTSAWTKKKESLAIAGEEVSRLSIVGIPVAMGLSFATTYKALKYILNSLAEDAQMVFTKALGK